jgi:hypothetical protein
MLRNKSTPLTSILSPRWEERKIGKYWDIKSTGIGSLGIPHYQVKNT